MLLRYYGHSFFSLENAEGYKICFDPYGKLYNYPMRKVPCDLCLISHHHDDHDGVACVDGNYQVIDQPGFFQPASGVAVKGVQTDHDEKNGTLRGKNTIFIVEADGLRIAHCGDLGHELTEDQAAAIGHVDVLLLPVGGYYTIDAQTALKVRSRLAPGLTIPMHYQTEYNRDMPIQPLDAFLNQAGAGKLEALSVMRFTKEDIGERGNLVLMAIPE